MYPGRSNADCNHVVYFLGALKYIHLQTSEFLWLALDMYDTDVMWILCSRIGGGDSSCAVALSIDRKLLTACMQVLPALPNTLLRSKESEGRIHSFYAMVRRNGSDMARDMVSKLTN